MKKLVSIVLAISMLLVTISMTSVVANAATSNAVTLTSLTCDSEETAVTAKMNFNTSIDCTVILAVYDSFGKLLNVTYKDSPATTGEFSMHLSGEQSFKNCAAKVFFMDSLNDFQPVNAPISGIVKLDESGESDYVKIRGVVVETPLVYLDGYKDIDTTKKPEVAIHVYDDYGTENKEYIDYYGSVYGSGRECVYFVGDTHAEDYLGRSVIAYVKPSVGALKFEIDSIEVDTLRDKTLTMRLDQFEAYIAGEIEYYEDGASKSTFVKTEGNIPLVFNYAGGYDVADLNALVGSGCLYGGEITLIDNDDVMGYDVAFCTLAATAVVKKVTANSISLYNNAYVGGGAYTKTIYVYPEDITKVVRIYKDGEIINHTELKEWDILSIYGESSRADVIIAEVISNKIDGTVSGVKTSKSSADGCAYKINDVWYDVAEGVYDEGLDVGVTGTFYVDEFGKIVAFIDASASTGNYGYVIAVKADEAEFGAAGSCVVKAQILTADGVKVYEVRNNAKFNTSDGATNTLNISDWTFDGEVSNDYGLFDEFASNSGSIVKYTEDSNGRLATITEAGYSKGGILEPEFEIASIYGAHEFDKEVLKLGRNIDIDAVIFVVGDSVDKCFVISVADLEDKTEYNVIASYRTKKADDADILVITFDTFNGVSAASNVAVVSGLSTSVDADGLTVYAVDYLQDGVEKSAVTTAEVYDFFEYDLTVGDVVKVKKTGDVITYLDFVFDFAEGVRDNSIATGGMVEYSSDIGYPGVDESFVGGVVTGYAERNNRVVIDGYEYSLSKGVNFYEVNPIASEVAVTVKEGPTFTSIADSIYDYTTDGVKLLDSNNNVIHENISVEDVQKLYADYVYIRTFEDEIVDVIVVKGYNVKTPEKKINVIYGSVTETKVSATSADGMAYKIDDIWYDISDSPINDSVYVVSVGSGGEFYIDESGKIIAYFEDVTLTDGLEYEYGYVIATAAQETDFGAEGSCILKVQMLTSDGIEIFEVKNNAKHNKMDCTTVKLNINDWYMDDYGILGDDGKYEGFSNIARTVVKFGTDANGYIASIIEAEYATGAVEADFEHGRITGVCEFDAEDGSLGSKAIDPDTTVFVVDSIIDNCFVASAGDLEHLVEYEVVASYRTRTADDADILVITFASFNGVSAASNVAVVSGLSTTTDEDGFTVFAIEYLQNGEEYYALTNADIYDAYEYDLTVGDVIKVKKKGDVITSLAFVFDFAEGVRDNRIATGSTVSVNVGTAGMDELFVGGVVTNYNDNGDRVTINGNEYRLEKGVNFYEIDMNARDLVITAEEVSTFTSLSELLYNGETTTVDVFNNKGVVLIDNIRVDDVQELYADYVYIRLYGEDIVDVIVVKGYDVIVADSSAYEW